MKLNLPKTLKRTGVACAVSLCLSANSQSAIVRSDLDYQLYRDFAENKGQFRVNASTFPIYKLSGKHLGTMSNGVPMIDFSVADRNNGVAVAIAPQYITSVAHNVGYGTVQFGNQGPNPEAHHFTYQIVDRNDYPDGQPLHKDYHVPRLHKLITEIAPIPITSAGLEGKTYLDRSRFPLFTRVGAGVQMKRDEKGNNQSVSGAYQYLIGGTPTKVIGDRYGWIDAASSLYEDHYGPLTTYGMPGDSGSSLFAFDRKENRWVQLGVLNFYTGANGNRNIFAIARKDFIKGKQQEDVGFTDVNIEQNGVYDWNGTSDKLSTISPPVGKAKVVDLADPSQVSQDSSTAKPSLNHGKNISISGKDASLVLHRNINQGAGSLHFNANVTVRPSQDQTWQGSGVIVEEGKQVNWQVKNPQGDRLSKIGKGTLNVSGKGVNLGDISVGEGVVLLNQQADSQGRKQAFNQVGIVSGRSTVRLGSTDQIDLNKLYFGFRGGRLDLNGNQVSAAHIQNVDGGAMIVNHKPNSPARLTLTGKPLFTAADLRWGEWSKEGGDLYEYVNNHRTDYFTLKGSPSSPYPIDQKSDSNWEFLSSDKRTAINTVLMRKNNDRNYLSFNGVFGESRGDLHNGRLDVHYRAERRESLLHLNGSSNLNGELVVDLGRMLLSGKPTPHAYDHLNKQEVVLDHDWQNSQYRASRFVSNNTAEMYIGRNVSNISGSFVVRHNSKMFIGFEQGKMPNCRYSDYFGFTDCQEQAVIYSHLFANLPTTQAGGNAFLTDNGLLSLGKATLHGTVQGDRNTTLRLSSDAKWHNSGESKIGNLILENGSEITLNNAYFAGSPGKFNKLLLQGDLNGKGRFNYVTNAAEGRGDHIEVQGIAQGEFTLAVKDSGKEPGSASPLSLLTLKHAEQSKHSVNVHLDKNYVDLGAYRYVLSHRNGDYRLYNPLKDVPSSFVPQGVAIDNAIAVVKQREQGVEVARQQQQDVLAKQQIQKQALTKANQRLDAANSELNRLLALAKSNRWFAFLFSIPLEVARNKVQQAKNGVTATQQQLSNMDAEIRKVEEALTAAKNAVSEANKALNAEMDNAIREEAKRRCTNDPNIPHCELGLYRAAAVLQADWISRTANAALSELSAQTNSLLQIEQQLEQQQLTHQTGSTVWAGHNVQQAEYGSNRYRSYRQNGQVSQVGGSFPISETWRIGGAVSVQRANQQFDDNIGGSSRTQAVSLFAKWQSASGLFSVINSKIVQSEQKLDDVRFKRQIFSAGVTFGRDIELNGVQIQPSVGVKYYRFGKADYTFGGSEIHTPKQHFLTYQAGLKVAKTFGETWKITPSLAAYYLDASQSKQRVAVNNIAFEQRFGRTARFEGGLNIENANWQFDTTLGYQKGNELRKQRFARVNVAYRF